MGINFGSSAFTSAFTAGFISALCSVVEEQAARNARLDRVISRERILNF